MKTNSGWVMLLVALGAALAGAGCDTPAVLVDTTRMGNTFDQQGPYVVRTVLGGSLAPDEVTLVHRAGELAESEVRMTPLAGLRGVYEAVIGGRPAFTQISYFVRMRCGELTTTDPPDVDLGVRFGFWVLGTPCKDPVDCGPGETCHLPSGACLQLGGTVCSADRDCGTGRRCDAGECRLASRQCGECGLNEVCGPLSDQCIPRPLCEGGLACPLDFVCESTTDTCRRYCTGLEHCNRDEQCQSGFCRLRRQ